MKNLITVEVRIQAPLEKVWSDFTDPRAIKEWNAASPDWHTTKVENDFRVGGKLSFRMEAKDGSEGFNLTGTYLVIIPHSRIGYVLADGREVNVNFMRGENDVHIVETFVPETENPLEVQRAGWQAILDNFKVYVENSA